MPWERDNAKLLPHAQHVQMLPCLNNLTGFDAIDRDSPIGDSLANWFDVWWLIRACRRCAPPSNDRISASVPEGDIFRNDDELNPLALGIPDSSVDASEPKGSSGPLN